MPTLAERAAAMLARNMKLTRGVAVTYTRSATAQSVTLTAWVGRTEPAAAESRDGAVAVSWGDRDYLFTAADLVLGGAPAEPAVGDRITEAGVGGRAFDVYAPPGQKPWKWSDEGRTVIRVHTVEKQVG